MIYIYFYLITMQDTSLPFIPSCETLTQPASQSAGSVEPMTKPTSILAQTLYLPSSPEDQINARVLHDLPSISKSASGRISKEKALLFKYFLKTFNFSPKVTF